ncbi:MAG: biotin--[acetyl-CoA-carboxylase] ligase [Thermodesulfobacteriota bacterium]
MGFFYIWSGDVPDLVDPLEPASLADCQYWDNGEIADAASWSYLREITCSEEQGFWWQFNEPHQGADIIICGSCSSVLDVSWRLSAAHCLKKWDSLLSTRQWAGRGQLKRNWSSPVGNIYAALKLPPVEDLAHTRLPVLIGLCLIRAFSDLGHSLKLKWPNDLLLDRKKVGGILVEEKKKDVFAGIGINLNRLPEISEFGNTGGLAVQKLLNSHCAVDPASYWQRLVHRFVLWYEVLVANESMHDIAVQVEQVMDFLGEQARISPASGEPYTATVLGLDPYLGLKIGRKGKQEVLYNASLF